MQLQTTRFGLMAIDPDQIIAFTQPILGFLDYRYFILIPGPSDALRWLQSTESGELAFLLMSPFSVMPEYEVTLRPSDQTELDATSTDALEIYTLVVVPADPRQIRTNLRAPIVINPQRRLAKQIVLENGAYPIQFFLAQQPDSPSEDSPHARTDA